jgi:hypothetical protein
MEFEERKRNLAGVICTDVGELLVDFAGVRDMISSLGVMIVSQEYEDELMDFVAKMRTLEDLVEDKQPDFHSTCLGGFSVLPRMMAVERQAASADPRIRKFYWTERRFHILEQMIARNEGTDEMARVLGCSSSDVAVGLERIKRWLGHRKLIVAVGDAGVPSKSDTK